MDNKKLVVLVVTLLAALVLPGASLAQGPEFTYQGKLEEDGSPANGTFDFQFKLFDAGGNQVAPMLTRGDVPVSDGYFSVALDFMNVFDGSDRFLEIGVRPGSSTGGYTTLSPRQELTATPYAIYAQNAPWGGLADVPAGFADGIDNVGSGWELSGNSGTNPTSNFLGTTDNQALELRVNNTRSLRLEPGNSPNLIGGYAGNNVASGVVGATIAGGGNPTAGHNSVSADYAAVGGGENNQVSTDADYAVIGGGLANTASGHTSTIGGGNTNTTIGDGSTVAGGDNNTATGSYAAIGGGDNNSSTGEHTTIAGGDNNTAGGQYATIGGGQENSTGDQLATIGGGHNNTADGQMAVIGGGTDNSASGEGTTISGGRFNIAASEYVSIGGGRQNTATAPYSTIGGGNFNEAQSAYSTIGGGIGAGTTVYGQMAYASGAFTSYGDAQASLYVMRGTSSDTNWHNLRPDGATQWLTVPNGKTIVVDGLVVGRSDAGESAGYSVSVIIEDGSRSVGTPSVVPLGEDDTDWDVRFQIISGQGILFLQAKGNGENIRWVATLRAAEVAW
jgi:hypothetical protein